MSASFYFAEVFSKKKKKNQPQKKEEAKPNQLT